MVYSQGRSKRLAVLGMIAVLIAVVISSLGIVRAQRLRSVGNISYSCNIGRACVSGTSTGTAWGVYGSSSGNNGVEGQSSASGAAGVAGLNDGAGNGVYAESADSSGKFAAFFARGDQAKTNIFYGFNNATSASCLIDPNANLTCHGSLEGSPAANVAGIVGNSSQNYGVEGISTTADGVHGITSSTTGKSAVAGIAIGTTGSSSGVYGSSANGSGVTGVTSATGTTANIPAAGVYGQSGGFNVPGVYGTNTLNGNFANDEVGVYGQAGGTGVFGSGGVAGVEAVSTGPGATTGVLGEDYVALYASVNSASDDLFDGQGYPTYNTCSISASANLTCTGTIQGGKSLQTRHRTSSGAHVLAYASESTRATIEDFGTARMVAGVVNVPIDPAFASTISRDSPYYVFLTPLGNTRGLYVSMKGATDFQVRETEGGHSTLGFDYRIVAHPLDASDDRLPTAPVHPAIRRAPAVRLMRPAKLIPPPR